MCIGIEMPSYESYGGAQGIGFDLTDGDGGAGHAAGKFGLGQVEGLAVLFGNAAERDISVHGCSNSVAN